MEDRSSLEDSVGKDRPMSSPSEQVSAYELDEEIRRRLDDARIVIEFAISRYPMDHYLKLGTALRVVHWRLGDVLRAAECLKLVPEDE